MSYERGTKMRLSGFHRTGAEKGNFPVRLNFVILPGRKCVPCTRIPAAWEQLFDLPQDRFYKMKPQVSEYKNNHKKQQNRSDFSKRHVLSSLCCEFFHKEVGEGGQLLVLGHVNIQLFVLQPVIGVDGDVSFFVRVNDKRVGGVFVAVGL